MRDEEVEVQVREEEGLAFQYPERIKSRALDGRSLQSYTGCMKGEEERRPGGGAQGTRGQHCEPDASWLCKAAQACGEEQEKIKEKMHKNFLFVLPAALKRLLKLRNNGECIYKPLRGIKVREIRRGQRSAKMKTRQI